MQLPAWNYAARHTTLNKTFSELPVYAFDREVNIALLSGKHRYISILAEAGEQDAGLSAASQLTYVKSELIQ